MLFSKGKEFFDQIDRVAQTIIDAARILDNMLEDFTNPEVRLKELKDKEHIGDRLTHDTIELLNKTFITPLDREDIHSLITSMDDILDYIYGSADRIVLYKIPYISEDLKALAKVLLRTVERVYQATVRLNNMKNSQMILAECIQINRLESEADAIHRRAVGVLFAQEKDPIQIIKLKEILDHMEIATDRCEDVANVIEGIVLKNA